MPESHCANVLGMAETATNYADDVLANAVAGRPRRRPPQGPAAVDSGRGGRGDGPGGVVPRRHGRRTTTSRPRRTAASEIWANVLRPPLRIAYGVAPTAPFGPVA